MATETTTTTELIPVEKQQSIENASKMIMEFLKGAKQIKITSQDEYDNSVEICKKIMAKIKELESDRVELVKPIKDQATKIDQRYREVRCVLENGESVFKSAMKVWFAEQERKRIEEQRKLEAEAEAKRKAEEERALKELQKAEEYRAQGREAMAEKAEARAETSINVAQSTVAQVVTNSAKVAGVGFRKVIKARIINEAKAKLSCCNNPVLSSYVTLDIKGLERLATAQKGNLQIDGIEFFEDFSTAVRS